MCWFPLKSYFSWSALQFMDSFLKFSWFGNSLISLWLLDTLKWIQHEDGYFDGLAQDCRNYDANALELLQSCAKPLISSTHPYMSLCDNMKTTPHGSSMNTRYELVLRVWCLISALTVISVCQHHVIIQFYVSILCYNLLMAPSHPLNQCWRIISDVLWHSPDDNIVAHV